MDINNLTENVLRRMPANLTQIEQASDRRGRLRYADRIRQVELDVRDQ